MLTGPGPGCGLPPRRDKTCVVLGVDWPEFIEIKPKPTDQFSMLSIVGHILPFPARKCLVVANQFLATLIYIISSLSHDIDLRVCMAVQFLGYSSRRRQLVNKILIIWIFYHKKWNF